MNNYKSGQVSAQLFSSNLSKKLQNDDLVNLFSIKKIPMEPPKSSGFNNVFRSKDNMTSEKQQPRKAINHKFSKPVPKTQKVNQKGNVSKLDSNPAMEKKIPAWRAPFIHETLGGEKSQKQKSSNEKTVKRKAETQNKDENEEFVGKRPRRNRVRDKTTDSRTVFVGNCPLSADKKVLKSLFKEYGEIESIRFRCAPPADPNLPRRAIVITKNFHEKCKSYVAYIVFKEEKSAKKALVRNGHLLDGLHLRVDISTMSKKHDKKRSIFVGNLPFDIREEDLWSQFEDCGEITNVRIVRDRQTSLGKGIGYVQFESKDSVSLALKLNKTNVKGREIRIMVCTNKEKDKTGLKKNKKPNKTDGNDSGTKNKLKLKRPLFGPSNSTSVSFQEKLKLKKEKRLRKMKKRKELAKKSDDLSSAISSVPKPRKNSTKKKLSKGKKSKTTKVKLSTKLKGKKSLNKSKSQKDKLSKNFKRKDKPYKKKV